MRLIILVFVMNCNAIFAQSIFGIIVNEKSKLPVEYVNIGVEGKNIGTVSDINGKYHLSIDPQFDNDSLIFFSIGYLPFSVKIGDLKKAVDKSVFLKEKVYVMKEVVVRPKIFKQHTLGVNTHSKMIRAGFDNNLLGYECGILMEVKKTAVIKKVNINFSECTYDTVFYRLNIYSANQKRNFENVMRKPIYINLPKDKLKDKIIIDLQSQDIVVDGDFLVTLEHVKDLGPGHLYFCAGLSKKTYIRESPGIWETIPVGISISVEASVEK